jgi:DNA-binding MarR family transcriptional regulator
MPIAVPSKRAAKKPAAIPQKRWDVLQSVHKAGRTHSAHSTVFYSIIASKLGLALSDLRVWDLLYYRDVPMNAGQVGDVIGLTQGAVTGILKRLARVGAISSEPDPSDRRRVVVRVLGSFREGKAEPYFEQVQARIRAMYGKFTDDELAMIARYMQEMASLLHIESMELRSGKNALTRLEGVRKAKRAGRGRKKK